MTAAPSSATSPPVGAPHATLIIGLRWLRRSVIVAGLLLLLALWIGPSIFAAPPSSSRSIALDIMPVKPGGPPLHYAAYLPSTALSVPAHATITVTIRNFDLDAAPVPAGPAPSYLRVAGVLGGVATADGAPYTAVDRANLAHTFTIPALNINVPIPAHASASRTYVTITFRFHTGAAGTLLWKCSAPCGEGPDGETGAMADDAYMRGALVVHP